MTERHTQYQVTAIEYGYQWYPGPAVFYFSHWFEWVRLSLYFWLLEGTDRTVLVDTGMSQEHADAANPQVCELVGDKAELCITVDPLDALAELGFQPGDVDDVIITHTHLDHVSNIAKFPNATFIMSRTSYAWNMEPWVPQLVRPVAVPQHAIEFLKGEATSEGRLQLTADRAEVLPGVVIVRTGAHSVDHQAVLVNTPHGRVGLVVDDAPLYANLESGVPVGSPVDALAAAEALTAIAAEADIVIPGHDPQVALRFANGQIATGGGRHG